MNKVGKENPKSLENARNYISLLFRPEVRILIIAYILHNIWKNSIETVIIVQSAHTKTTIFIKLNRFYINSVV